MITLVGPPNPLLDDDSCISEELIGRLRNATEGSVPDLVAAFTANERASLAMFCYHRSHLRPIGLAIATTCDLNSLVKGWGVILGQAVFAQSREPCEKPLRMGVRTRPKITLARSAGRYFPPPIDPDEIPQPTCSAPTECVELLGATYVEFKIPVAPRPEVELNGVGEETVALILPRVFP